MAIDASTHRLWNFYLKKYSRYAPDTKRDGRTDSAITICLPKLKIKKMKQDRPGTDTEELDQQQEHDVHDRAASVLSSIDDIPELEDAPVQQPRSRITMEGEYLGVPIGPRARGDISSKAIHSFLHTSAHNSKGLSNVTRLDITWMSCDSLHAWF